VVPPAGTDTIFTAMSTSAGEGSRAAAATVRYQVTDVEQAIAFYTRVLDFKVEMKAGPAFAMVSRGALHLILGGPGSSGARAMPDGRRQEPGGWNRIVLYVDDLNREIDRVKAAGARFRNSVEVGPGGSQIQIEDPDGNPIELHEGGAGSR
jgi:glyoxylase I family protein